MSHANARLTPAGAAAADPEGGRGGTPGRGGPLDDPVSRGTLAKWWRRWVEHGDTA